MHLVILYIGSGYICTVSSLYDGLQSCRCYIDVESLYPKIHPFLYDYILPPCICICQNEEVLPLLCSQMIYSQMTICFQEKAVYRSYRMVINHHNLSLTNRYPPLLISFFYICRNDIASYYQTYVYMEWIITHRLMLTVILTICI